MTLSSITATLALLSLVLLLWQWALAIRFLLHRRLQTPGPESDGTPLPKNPALSILRPLKGCDEFTEACLRSWFEQDYGGPVQYLFGVASSEDPVCKLVHKLIDEFPGRDARLVIAGPPRGANPKVSTLIELEKIVSHPVLIVSDADVRVPNDFLSNVIIPLQDERTGLVNCFYRLANPGTLAMQWEAVAINADFWSQVLQARSLKPLDFALGAVMVVRAGKLREIGGFAPLIDCLADDYQLGYRIARSGAEIEISPVVVECLSAPMSWKAVWKHQLRWARTIRVCRPAPYFFSILSNSTLWSLLWSLCAISALSAAFLAGMVLLRVISALHLQSRLAGTDSKAAPRFPGSADYCWWMPPVKDLLQVGIWLGAFLGNSVEWRGERLRLRSDGTLIPAR